MSSFDINKQISPLLDNYVPQNTPQQRMYTGGHFEELKIAQSAVQAAWQSDFGTVGRRPIYRRQLSLHGQ